MHTKQYSNRTPSLSAKQKAARRAEQIQTRIIEIRDAQIARGATRSTDAEAQEVHALLAEMHSLGLGDVVDEWKRPALEAEWNRPALAGAGEVRGTETRGGGNESMIVRVRRARQIEQRLTEIRDAQQRRGGEPTAAEARELESLCGEFESLGLTASAATQQTRADLAGSLMDGVRSGRYGTEGDDDQRGQGTSRRPSMDGQRGDAMRVLDRMERRGALPTGLARYEALLAADRDDNVDADEVARYLLAAGTEAYASAFRKAYRAAATTGNVAMAALEFDDDERAAWARAQQYVRAVALSGTGGVLVPAQLDPIIVLTNAGTSGSIPLRQAFTVRTTTSNVYTAVTSAGVAASYGPEASEVADGNPVLGSVPITIHRGSAFIPFSIEVGMDAQGDFASEMTRLLLDGKDRAEAAAFVNGSGTGQPWGIATRLVQASKTVSSAAADTIALGDVYATRAAVPARWRGNGQWLVNDIAADRIRRTSETLTGSSNAWTDSLADGVPSRLLGYPAYLTTELEAPGQTAAAGNDEVAIYGDLKQYVVADRLGAVVEFVPQIFGAAGRPTGQRGYVLWWRNGGDLVVPDAARVLRT